MPPLLEMTASPKTSKKPTLSLKMPDSRHEKVKKNESCAEMEGELEKYLPQLKEAVDNEEGKVRVKRLNKLCEEAMTNDLVQTNNCTFWQIKLQNPKH